MVDRQRWAARGGIAAAVLAGAAVVLGAREGAAVDLPWAPAWNLRLSFAFDGLGSLYALLATGVGVLVAVYSSRYVPHHLEKEVEEEGKRTEAAVRFWALLLLFLASMVGLVLARDLFLLFLFWDSTAITSYFLIGFDRGKKEAREAALLALLITGISAVCLLIGALMLFVRYGTFSIPELLARAEPGPHLTVAAGLI